MVKELIAYFESLTGLDYQQMLWISVTLSISISLAVWIGRGLGWRAARHELRQFKKGLDDDHIVIERLVFEDGLDGEIIFDREAEGGIRPLKEVFGSDGLVEKIRSAIRKSGDGARIFSPGPLHRLMMERVDAFITGNDRAASQSAMFGRREEYHLDVTAFTVRYMVGEDGFSMLHVLLINPEHLAMMSRKVTLRRLKPRRQSYQKKYFGLIPNLAEEFEDSAKLFQKIGDEDAAGEQATFWTALIRTRKQMPV